MYMSFNTTNEQSSCNSLGKLKQAIYRGSYMSADVLLNLLKKLGKRDKM